MHEGYWALLLCILKDITPEQAFMVIEGRGDVDEMIRLREEKNMSYREIAKIYGINHMTVYRKIKNARREAAS